MTVLLLMNKNCALIYYLGSSSGASFTESVCGLYKALKDFQCSFFALAHHVSF